MCNLIIPQNEPGQFFSSFTPAILGETSRLGDAGCYSVVPVAFAVSVVLGQISLFLFLHTTFVSPWDVTALLGENPNTLGPIASSTAKTLARILSLGTLVIWRGRKRKEQKKWVVK